MQVTGFSNQAVNPLQRQVERDRRDPVAEPSSIRTNREQSQQQQNLRESTQSAQTGGSTSNSVSFDPAVILSSQRVDPTASVERNQTQRVQDEDRLPRQNQVAARAYESTQNYSVARRSGYGELAGIDVIV